MDGESEDDYDESAQSSDSDAQETSSDVYGLDDVVPPVVYPTPGPATGSGAPQPPVRVLQPHADDCSSYDIVPYVAAPHGCDVYALDATRNMKWIFTGGSDGYVRKYDFFASMSGKQLLTQNQKHAHVESVQKAGVILSYFENEEQPLPAERPAAPTSNGTAARQENGAGSEAVTPAETAVPQPPPSFPTEPKLSAVYSLAVHSEALWLLGGLESGMINLYTVRHEEGKCHHVLRQHKGPVSALMLTHDEQGVISGSWDKTVLHWDLGTGQVSREYAGHNSQISSMGFRPVVHSSVPQSPLTSSHSLAQAALHDEQSQEVTQTFSNDLLMTTSIDGNTLVWDRRAHGAPLRNIRPPDRTPPWCLSSCWSADGSKVYCGRRNGTVDEWDFSMGTFIRQLRLPGGSGPVSSVQSLPNNKHVICASTDNIRLWNTAEHETPRSAVPFLIVPGHHGGTISKILIDENCRYMITISGNRGWEGSSTDLAMFYEITPIV